MACTKISCYAPIRVWQQISKSDYTLRTAKEHATMKHGTRADGFKAIQVTLADDTLSHFLTGMGTHSSVVMN